MSAGPEKTPLSPEECLTHLLEECRMVLPGIQAMFGLQLVAVFNQPFKELLGHAGQIAHLAALCLMALAIGMVLAPAAYHRLVEPDSVSKRFLRLASRLLTSGMVFFMSGLLVDVFLIAHIILSSVAAAAAVATGIAGVLVGLWFIFPAAQMRRR